jgi:hypothetical protein
VSNDSSFMIPLDLNDWKDFGSRTSWCATEVWWTNQNIYLAGSSLGRTEAKVGDTVTVMVGVQGVAASGGATGTAFVESVQAWACYPSSTPGATSAALVLPSMTSSNPAFIGSDPVEGVNPAKFPGSYQNQSNPPGAYALFSLIPTWTPTVDDVVPPNTSVHCCLIATSAGTNLDGAPLGTKIPSNSDLATMINICTSPYQGQCNITILGMPIHKRSGRLLVQEFGFLAAGLNAASGDVVLDVAPVAQPNGVDPTVLWALKGGPYGELNLTPAASGLKSARLAKNTYKLTPHLSQIVRPAEKISESGTSLRLSLPPQGIQPLLLTVELDANSAPGSVYAFDITQTDATGKRGGIRIGAIVAP